MKNRTLTLLLVAALVATALSQYNATKLEKENEKWYNICVRGTLANQAAIQTIKNCVIGAFGSTSSCRSAILPGVKEPFFFNDLVASPTAMCAIRELEVDTYGLNEIEFKEGDVVIDIGGNVGVVSIYLAKKYPFLKIYAFEPVKENYENFKKNIKLNGIPDGVVSVANLAVTGDGRNIDLIANLEHSGTSANKEFGWLINKSPTVKIDKGVRSVTLDEIFKKYEIQHCKLLKIDCEGSEYEILLNASKDTLSKCDKLRMELHESRTLNEKFGTGDDLIRNVKQEIKDVKYFTARDS